MNADLPYAEARAAFPAAVDAVIAKQRAGRSRHRLDAPETLHWNVAWCVRVEGPHSFAAVLAQAAARAAAAPDRPVAPGPTAVDDRLADSLSRTSAMLCAAPKGQTGWYVALPDGVLPDAVVAQTRAMIATQVAEEHRIAGLTDAQREAEVALALAALRGQPGFLMLSVPVRRTR